MSPKRLFRAANPNSLCPSLPNFSSNSPQFHSRISTPVSAPVSAPMSAPTSNATRSHQTSLADTARTAISQTHTAASTKPSAVGTKTPAAGTKPPAVGLFVTVIVPVRNEAAHILATLRELVTQKYASGRFEILVIDGESEDATPELVRGFAERHPCVRLFHNPKRLSSAARNIGVREARGDVVVIIDGHCEIGNPRYIANVAKAFRRTEVDVLGRPQPLDVTNATPLQCAVAAARNSRLGHHPESFIYSDKPQKVPAKSVGVAYRRQVFDRVGFFDETFDAHEDGEFNHRSATKPACVCWFTPDVAVRLPIHEA